MEQSLTLAVLALSYAGFTLLGWQLRGMKKKNSQEVEIGWREAYLRLTSKPSGMVPALPPSTKKAMRKKRAKDKGA